jgi:hypothetical protein
MDSIPISIQLWNKPKNGDPQVSYATDRQKDDLWTSLKANFTLPPEEDPNKPVIEPLVKACALKKMADLFRRWKNELKSTFVDKGKNPEFTGRFEKIRDHWPAFVAYKTSDKSKKMLEINKINAAKKLYRHTMGSSGYNKARPLWDKVEQDLLAKGVQPVTLHWPDRARTWFFGVGELWTQNQGSIVGRTINLQYPSRSLRQQSRQHRKGHSFPTKRRTS